MDYIDIMLMILDPNYRALVHKVMKTIDEKKFKSDENIDEDVD
jgi:hypothetical protein